jgi:hypothetical protein
MPRDFIGVVRDPDGQIVAVINPDDDAELDLPWLADMGEVVRIPRGEYEGALSPEDVAEIVRRLAR